MKNILAEATEKELEIIRKHCTYYEAISLDLIEEVWRDEDGILCVGYKGKDWFHYDEETGTWW